MPKYRTVDRWLQHLLVRLVNGGGGWNVPLTDRPTDRRHSCSSFCLLAFPHSELEGLMTYSRTLPVPCGALECDIFGHNITSNTDLATSEPKEFLLSRKLVKYEQPATARRRVRIPLTGRPQCCWPHGLSRCKNLSKQQQQQPETADNITEKKKKKTKTNTHTKIETMNMRSLSFHLNWIQGDDKTNGKGFGGEILSSFSLFNFNKQQTSERIQKYLSYKHKNLILNR